MGEWRVAKCEGWKEWSGVSNVSCCENFKVLGWEGFEKIEILWKYL